MARTKAPQSTHTFGLEVVEVTYVYETDPHLSRICADGWRALFDLADRAAATKEASGQAPGEG